MRHAVEVTVASGAGGVLRTDAVTVLNVAAVAGDAELPRTELTASSLRLSADGRGEGQEVASGK